MNCEPIIHHSPGNRPVVGIECLDENGNPIRLLKSECKDEADYICKAAYFMKMAAEVRYLHQEDIQGDNHENQ